jgi:phage terminase small subunit
MRKKSVEDLKQAGTHLPKTVLKFREAAEKATNLAVVPSKKKIRPEDVEVPADLDTVAAKKYREVVAGEIFDDLESAELYSRTWSQKAEADADIQTNGRQIESERGWKANPSVRESLELGKQLAKLLAQRGRRKTPPESAGQKYIRTAIELLEAKKEKRA